MSEPGPRRAAGVTGWGEAVRGGAAVLAEAGVPSPEVDARLLAEHVCNAAPMLAAAPSAELLARYADLVERRRRREPLQHITGEMYFRYLRLRAARGAFIVRPETEMVAEHAIAAAAGTDRPRVVDLCTGSGAIALAVATEVPAARVWAVELSPEAAAVAEHNIAEHAPQVSLVLGDAATALAELDGTVDVVVANPPYIPPGAVPREAEVRDHDPRLALYGGGEDGLQTPRAVVATAARLLRPGGMLVMEHAEGQAAAVREICAAAGFLEVRTEADLGGRDRMVLARRTAG